MASYRIEWKQSARKELKSVEPGALGRLLTAVESLAANPRPPCCRKLLRAPVGISEGRVNIFTLQTRVQLKHTVHRFTGGEQTGDGADGDADSANAGLAAHGSRVDGDALQLGEPELHDRVSYGVLPLGDDLAAGE